MKSNEKGFRTILKLAMKYKVWTDGNIMARCLVCGWECQPGFAGQPIPDAPFWGMATHIRAHIERDEITEQNVISTKGESS